MSNTHTISTQFAAEEPVGLAPLEKRELWLGVNLGARLLQEKGRLGEV